MSDLALTIRVAQHDDLPVLASLMARAIDTLQRSFLSDAAIAASAEVMGLDTQLIADGSYFVVEAGREIVGCGGWSRRATLYGGDHSTALRNDALLDPATDAARVRAMYTDPGFARRGVGRLVIRHCEAAARAHGFTRTELMATLSGEPLYRSCGYEEIDRVVVGTGDRAVPLIRMGKTLVAGTNG